VGLSSWPERAGRSLVHRPSVGERFYTALRRQDVLFADMLHCCRGMASAVVMQI
jgi:hypothetical protein